MRSIFCLLFSGGSWFRREVTGGAKSLTQVLHATGGGAQFREVGFESGDVFLGVWIFFDVSGESKHTYIYCTCMHA